MGSTSYYFLKWAIMRKRLTDQKLKQLVLRMTFVSMIGFGLTYMAVRINNEGKVLEKT